MLPDDFASLGKYWDNRAQREPLREQQNPNKIIHTELLFRMIRRYAKGPGCRVLDAGGGAGRYSVPLALEGNNVVHTDISKEMLKLASEAAETKHARSIVFEEASVTDLSRYSDKSFDLVLAMDAPVSSCHTSFPIALNELCRVAADMLLLAVFNRSGTIMGAAVDFDYIHFGKLKTVPEMFKTGNLDVTEELRKLQPKLMPSWHAFTPKELMEELEKRGFQTIEVSSPGTLARFVPVEILSKIISSETYQQFLDFEEQFDRQPDVLGVGSNCASGLAVAAKRK